MTGELRERYDEDKAHYEVIREIIRDEFNKMDIDSKVTKKVKDKMTGIYWLFGILVVIYVAVAGPLSGSVIGIASALSVVQESKASKAEIDVLKNERVRDYVQKLDYYKMEVDEHEKIKEAIENPARAEYVLKAINDHIRFEMNLNYTTSRGAEIK